jgi:hypothetical protein
MSCGSEKKEESVSTPPIQLSPKSQRKPEISNSCMKEEEKKEALTSPREGEEDVGTPRVHYKRGGNMRDT